MPTSLRRLGDGDYFFCADAACDVVYYDESGATFGTADIRVPCGRSKPSATA